MTISSFERNASIAEMAVEIDRRGAVIESLEARLAHIDGIYRGAIDNLNHHQTQLDMDGVMVGVSRQALSEVLAGVEAALSAALPITAPPEPDGTFSGTVDGDTPLQAAAREAGWALMELVDSIDWRKRDQVSDIISKLGAALTSPPARGDVAALSETIRTRLLGVDPDSQDVVLEDDDWRIILAALPLTAPPARIAILPYGLGVCLSGQWAGWQFVKHADSGWVSDRKLPTEDLTANMPAHLASLFSLSIGKSVEPALTAPPPPTHDIEAYYARQIDWSRETFGPALRTKGVIDHIRKELLEIEEAPHDLSEWVDVIILAMDGFWRHGGAAESLMPTLLAKQAKNMARAWPDWRTMSEDRAIEHDRSGDQPTAPPARGQVEEPKFGTILSQIALWAEDEGLDLSMGQGDDLVRRILSAFTSPAEPAPATGGEG